ncbi:beta-ketoacyl synthase N-terminal-like domain-containing protein [Rhodococcus sp. LW-XY12]|uniref:beta-ketoacyl synthase N-terminal-like domain-containing protein n=1 Tax=Rhodococcus TaxID=1827 RepID=UPI001C58E5C9|nr:beta-ketoacyl synthase N-terminal-like domain-containing protein [Rhodococcus sp. LW-XY12]QXU55595.1 hypothetical protein KXC42_10580 [Rhodococcus sp. LW-XY12]
MYIKRGTASTAIAVVGMGCRYPGATGIDEFWSLLINGEDAFTEVPSDRFDIAAVFDPTPGTLGKAVSRYGVFVDDTFGVDAAFFNMAPVEAGGMDPRQRLLLQVTWEALENIGIRPSMLAGSRSGVFVGQATAEYGEQYTGSMDIRESASSRVRGVTSGRLSYALDLRGPSLTVDTLEAGLQSLLALLPLSGSYLPRLLGGVRISADIDTVGPDLWSAVRAYPTGSDGFGVDAWLMTVDGQIVAKFKQICLTKIADRRVPPVTTPPPVVIGESPCDFAGHFMRQVAGVLGTDPDRINPRRGLKERGLDSLMAVDLFKRSRRGRGSSPITPSVLREPTSIADAIRAMSPQHPETLETAGALR